MDELHQSDDFFIPASALALLQSAVLGRETSAKDIPAWQQGWTEVFSPDESLGFQILPPVVETSLRSFPATRGVQG